MHIVAAPLRRRGLMQPDVGSANEPGMRRGIGEEVAAEEMGMVAKDAAAARFLNC